MWKIRFKQEDAAIFFGRGTEIRKLYTYITGIHPIILLYGKSGVGKSSLLEAGLAPRIENNHTVKYIRRIQAKGLIGSLTQALQEAGAEYGLADLGSGEKNEIRTNREELREQLEKGLVTAYVRQLLEAELQKLNAISSDTLTLLERWRQIEKEAGRLIIILDQVEETFTRPMPTGHEGREELVAFLETVRDIFDQNGKGPQGKLILSYRKEFHSEIIESFEALNLPHDARVFLEQLDREGIIEAVEGLTRHPDTRGKYRLEIEKSAAGNLSEIIADDLLEDREFSIAPVLQILLTKMWKAAIAENPEAPRFMVERYRQFKKALLWRSFLRSRWSNCTSGRPKWWIPGWPWMCSIFIPPT